MLVRFPLYMNTYIKATFLMSHINSYLNTTFNNIQFDTLNQIKHLSLRRTIHIVILS